MKDMMLLSVVLGILGCVRLTLGSGGTVVVYHGEHAPNFWHKISEECCGSNQSPIDLRTSKIKYRKNLGPIRLSLYDKEFENKSLVFHHIVNTIQVDIPSDAEISVSAGGLDGVYKLAQFHMHWGLTDQRGSEHTVNGAAYPAELHFVHYNEKYGSVSEAVQHSDGLAVLGVFVEVDDCIGTPHAGFETLNEAAKGAKYPGDHFDIEQPLRMSDLLPKNTDDYIRYSGSLTTPNCNEVVAWTIFNSPIVVTHNQLEQFRRSLKWTGLDGDYVTHADNYRPVQPLNGRKVSKSVHDDVRAPNLARQCTNRD